MYEISRQKIGLGHEVGLKFSGSEMVYKTDLAILGSLNLNLGYHMSVDLRYAHGYTKL